MPADLVRTNFVMRRYYKQSSCAVRARVVSLRTMNRTSTTLPVAPYTRITYHATVYFPAWTPCMEALRWLAEHHRILEVSVYAAENSVPAPESAEDIESNPSGTHYTTRNVAAVTWR